MVNSNLIMTFFGIKVLRVVFTYTSLLIAKNFTSQIYMDKVLVNGENPPKLSNMIYLYLIIEALMMAIFLALLFTADKQYDLGFSKENDNLYTQYVLPDYIISTIFIIIYGSIISNKMYQKKYFLYKDDGLRAIRALSELLFSISIINTSIPWNYVVFGLMGVIGDVMNELEKK